MSETRALLTERADLIERTLAALPEDPTDPVDTRTRARLEGYVHGLRDAVEAGLRLSDIR